MGKANKKWELILMESVAGVMMPIIKTLEGFIHDLGGSFSDIHRLATPEGASTLRRIAEIIVEAGKETTKAISTLLTLNPFDHENSLDNGWSIEWQDPHPLALNEIDLSKIKLATTLKKDEKSVNGEENLRRLKATENTLLDARVFHALWNNKRLIPDSWKGQIVCFPGTVLRGPDGYRNVFCLCWGGDDWNWRYYWLGSAWRANSLSAVLAKTA